MSIQYRRMIQINLYIATTSFRQAIKALRSLYFQPSQIPFVFWSRNGEFPKERHEGIVSSKGKSTDFHLVYTVYVELGEELHVVVDMSLVALEILAADDSWTQ